MGICVDRYVCVDLSVFGEIVDKLGGVSMHVPSDMDYDDPVQGLHIHLKKGDQILNGTQAQMFVRYRSGYTRADLGRMDAQKLFLASLAKQMKSTLTFKRAAELACSCFGKVKTNMTMRECVSCVRMLMDVELDAIQMATLIGEDVRPREGGAWYYILNRASARAQIEQMLGLCGEFDPDGVFTNPKKSEYQRIYLSEDGRFLEETRSAKDLIEGNFAAARIS
jgi:anionic cell wall polymer biosynthesis LytR-Cps2A-Psr (LCP) family protein